MYLGVLLILKRSGQAAGQMAKDMTAKSSISSSLVLLLYCPQPFPLSLYCREEKKKNIFSIFSVSSSSAKHFFCALARTQTQHISYQVKAGSEEATAPDSIQSDWAPMSTDKVMTFLS